MKFLMMMMVLVFNNVKADTTMVKIEGTFNDTVLTIKDIKK